MTIIDLGTGVKLRFDPKDVRISIDGNMIDIGARIKEPLPEINNSGWATPGIFKIGDCQIKNDRKIVLPNISENNREIGLLNIDEARKKFQDDLKKQEKEQNKKMQELINKELDELEKKIRKTTKHRPE